MHDLRRILLVEDDPNDVELTLMALAEYHLANEVLTVSDGAEALDFLFRRGKHTGRADADPGVVLLDVKMPKVSGIEVLRQIKADSELKVIPVVMLTSSREETDLVDSYNLGANAYVVKPVDFHAFAEAVKRLGVFWALVNEPPPNCFSAHGFSTSSTNL
jgi:CheY-like chemotaxis protein